MADEVIEGQEETKVEEPKGFGPEDVERMIAEAVGQTNKKWQSKFDQVLSEKKKVEMTAEERAAELEKTLANERLSWSRKTAKAKFGIDDDLEDAIQTYLSGEPDAIETGAERIAKYIKSKIEPFEAKINDYEKRLKFGSSPPPAGSGDNSATDMAQYNSLMAQGKTQQAMALLLKIQEKNKKV
jgi:hypothetical protein